MRGADDSNEDRLGVKHLFPRRPDISDLDLVGVTIVSPRHDHHRHYT